MCAGGAWHPCCCPAAAAVGSRAILRLARGLSNLSACFLPALFTKPQAWGLGVGCQPALMLGSPRELWFLNTLGQRGPKQHAPQTPLKNFPSPPSVAFRAVPLLSSGVTQDQGKNLCSVPRSWLSLQKSEPAAPLFPSREGWGLVVLRGDEGRRLCTPWVQLLSARCPGCGLCVAVCPLWGQACGNTAAWAPAEWDLT